MSGQGYYRYFRDPTYLHASPWRHTRKRIWPALHPDPHHILGRAHIFHGCPPICTCNLNFPQSRCYRLFVLLWFMRVCVCNSYPLPRGAFKSHLIWERRWAWTNSGACEWFMSPRKTVSTGGNHHLCCLIYLVLAREIIIDGGEGNFMKEISKGLSLLVETVLLTWRPEVTTIWPLRCIFMFPTNGSAPPTSTFHKGAFYCLTAARRLITKKKETLPCVRLVLLNSFTPPHAFSFFFSPTCISSIM